MSISSIVALIFLQSNFIFEDIDKLRKMLGSITSNRFKGILTGFSTTAVVQSSSVTTVMTVSLVNAGLLNLRQSAGVMMGANIGTTITAWLVLLIGFKVSISSY